MARLAAGAGPKSPPRHHGRTPAELLANAASAHRVKAADLDLSGVTVLIVEDHADSRDMLRQNLGSDADLRRTWEAGFNGHLVKPLDYETMAAQLERIFWAHRPTPAEQE